ncbi:hypothetical protein H7849_15780 [Alloacidobacterium dinghuense]|uniref:Uncharacterized protein n=1 Tax=Alloacidobacterium dinghuense TaxID=2763107 RepID=A0A7G8BDH4_9BACT|nr:hypothetical protein [Alloacidobacterium dinghuense]QNI30594.1 hypothetical protein H7849_15780 [Alloacidobacterium dinghuense]
MRTAQMDASELVDFRRSNFPIALWQDMVVLSVHHDEKGELPTDWKIATERLVYETLCILAAAFSPAATLEPDAWLAQRWIGTAPGQC